MARRASTKRRKRRKSVARRSPAASPRRRRRRAAVTVFAANPARRHRRRRRATVTARRRFRRNPPMGRAVLGTVVEAAKDGAAVVVGQVVARKATGALVGAFPTHVFTAMEKVGVTVAAAIGATLLARQLPGKAAAYRRLIAAGAFSEAINAALAQSKTASKILGGGSTTASTALAAFAPARVGVRAYPAALPRAGMRAYPAPRSSGLPVQVGN